MNVGAKVTGKYMGEIEFHGVVVSSRPLTVKTDGCLEHFVKLDEPVTVYGKERDTLVMNTLFDGSPSSYTKHTCAMQSIK